MTIRAIDLFCGGGGSSAGATLAGVEMIAGLDACQIATRTYSDNFPTAAGRVINERLTPGMGPEVFGELSGKIDLLLASPECTHHSIARGARPRCEISRSSGELIFPFLEKLTPRWIVLENVGGMIRWDGFAGFRERLERLGYKLRIHRADAADFGVPQQRRRIFIVGDRHDMPEPLRSCCAHAPASSIIDNVSNWRSSPLFKPGRAEATLQRARAAIDVLGEGTDFLIVYYGSDKAGGWQTLDRPLRTLTTLDRFGLVQWGMSGGPTLRMLQVPELKRAMGLPEWFQLRHGTRRDKVRLIGNGVSPPVMKAVVQSLTKLNLAADTSLGAADIAVQSQQPELPDGVHRLRIGSDQSPLYKRRNGRASMLTRRRA